MTDWKRITRFPKWLFLDFSGLRLIWRKIRPPSTLATGWRPPSTFLFWFVAVYVAFFGVASQRYENRIDLIENRATAIFAQLSSPKYRYALSRISIVQNMGCPRKPEILVPASILESLFGKQTRYQEIVSILKETIENWKDDLDGVNLSNADLEYCDLTGANLQSSNLSKARLQKAKLIGANLEGANIRFANLRGANLSAANLKNADLSHADLQQSDLKRTKLEGSRLSWARLWGSAGQPEFTSKADIYEQLSKAKNLFKAELHPKLGAKLEKEFPDLFVDPRPLPPSGIHIRAGEEPW